MGYGTYNQAKEQLKKHLYSEMLYNEGQLSIIFDKKENDFYIAEFPLKSNVYIASNEIDILNVDIAQLNEMYNDSLRENITDKNPNPVEFSDIVDSYIDTAEDEQIYDEKLNIVENVGVI